MNRIKEFIRKRLVHLKRNPQVIPKLTLVVACICFTFMLSQHSKSVRYIDNNPIAMFLFLTTLASFMSIFSFISVKKYNKSAIFPIAVTVALIALQIGLHINYLNVVNYHVTVTKLVDLSKNDFVAQSVTWTYVHFVFLGIALLAIGLLPVYSKLLQKIDTRPEAEKNARTLTEDFGAAPLETLEFDEEA